MQSTLSDSKGLQVRAATWSDEAHWNGYVDSNPRASVYHRWAWGELFESAYGTRNTPLVAFRNDRVVGILPLVELHPPARAPKLVSLPFFGHAGILADDPDVFDAIAAATREHARARGVRSIELRHAHPIPRAIPSRNHKVLMVLDLPDSVEALEKQVGSKIRSDVKRPRREGLTAAVGGVELVDAFHGVYAAVMRDLGSPCHSSVLFRAMARRFEDRAFVVCVQYQGRTVSAGFLVGQGDTLEIPCAGTLHTMNRLRANMLLYWTVLCSAIERGYRRFSFGRSTVDAGTYAFKRNWGAKPVPLPYHDLLADPATVASDEPPPTSEWLQRISRAWTHLPVPIATALGPRIVRHFP